MALHPYPLPPSHLIGWRGVVFGRAVTLVAPSDAYVASLDAHWPKLRPAGAEHVGWRWTRIRTRSKDMLALEDDNGTCLAIWSSRRSVLTLEGETFYRLDYLEVHPGSRGQGWGAVALAAVCARARELKAGAVLLAALPQAESYWDRVAVPRSPKGWNCPRELQPFVVESEAVANFERLFNGQFSPA